MEEGYAVAEKIQPARYEERSGSVDQDASQVEVGTRRMDSALEVLTKQASMLEERLARYLGPTPEAMRLASPDDAMPPVEAAVELHRQAGVVERVADLLGELRERFEG